MANIAQFLSMYGPEKKNMQLCMDLVRKRIKRGHSKQSSCEYIGDKYNISPDTLRYKLRNGVKNAKRTLKKYTQD